MVAADREKASHARGFSGSHDPAITLFFQNAEPWVARSMLSAFFVVAYPAAIAMLRLFGLFELKRAMVLLPSVGLELFLASLVRTFVDRRQLRAVMLATAAISGALLFVR